MTAIDIMMFRRIFHSTRYFLAVAFLQAGTALHGQMPAQRPEQPVKSHLEVTLPLPAGTVEENGAMFLAPVTRRSLYISAADSTIAVTVRIDAWHPGYDYGSLRPVDDISLPDTAGYGTPSSSGSPAWTVTREAEQEGRYLFRIDLRCGPGADGRLPSALSVSVDGADMRRENAHFAPPSVPEIPAVRPAFKSSGTAPRVMVSVSRAGMVRVTASMLRNAGWKPAEIDPACITVSCAGKVIPAFIRGDTDGRFNNGDYLEFFAERHWNYGADGLKSLDIYDERGIYIIECGTTSGPRFGQEEAVERNVPREDKRYPRSAPCTVHEEINGYFNRLPYAVNVTDSDHWLYAAPIQGGHKRDFPFTLEAPDEYAVTPITFRIKLRGQSSVTGKNRIDIFINSTLAASGEWEGITDIMLSADDVNPSALQEGVNTLSIANNAANGPLSPLMLDWFEITYPRLLHTDTDYIRFQAPHNSIGSVCRFELKGFSSPEIEIFREPGTRFLLPDITPVTDTAGVVTYTAVFEDENRSEAAVYHAFTDKAVLTPDTVRAVPASDIRSRLSGVNYVMVTPSDTLGTELLQPLIDLRESQGHHVLVADLQTVYDEFNYGIRNPAAIKALLRAVYNRRRRDDLYLLLVGDGFINNRIPAAEGYQIPVKIVQTVKYGAAAADHWYVCLDGDDPVPEMAVGRLPVTTAAELSLVVDKIVGYETAGPAPWMNRYLLIGSGGYNGVFYNQSEALIRTIMRPALHPERLYLAGDISDPDVGGTEDLLRHLRDGVMLVNFRGHGGGAIWADGGLLDLDDVDLLENRDRLAVMTSMTCFTGDFSSTRLSLGESLLRDTEAGAVAFWGATSLGWVYNDYYMLSELYTVMGESPDMPLGMMIKEAKTRYLAAYSGDLPQTEVNHYTLLGDPGLHLAVPAEQPQASLTSASLDTGDSLVITAAIPDAQSQSLTEVVTTGNRVVSSSRFSGLGGIWRGAVSLPASVKGSGGVRLYVWNEDSGYKAHAWAPFTINSAFFDSLSAMPAAPDSRDTLSIQALIEDRDGIERCWCSVIAPAPDSLAMSAEDGSGRFRTVRGIGPFAAGTLVTFSVYALNGNGRLSASDTLSLRILGDPDFLVRDIFFGGSARPEIRAAVVNNGPGDRDGIRVVFSDTLSGFSAADTVALPAYGETAAAVPFSPDPVAYTFSVCVNPDSSEPETRYTNNCLVKTLQADRFAVTPQDGSLNGSLQTDTLSLDSSFALFIPPGSVAARGVLTLGTLSGTAAAAMHADPAGSAVYTVHLSPSDTLEAPMHLFFTVSDQDTGTAIQPYRYDQALGLWTVLPPLNEAAGRRAVSSLFGGSFQMQHVMDTQPPRIEVTIKNQLLTSGVYVPGEPEILISVSDDGDLDPRGTGVSIYLDQAAVNDQQYILPDSSGDQSSFVLSYRPALTPGTHTLQVAAVDCNGNRTETGNLEMIVDEQLELHYLGNHPNPFRVETVFAYTLTAAAKRASLKIYTVAGTLIRSFETDEMAGADYHEILWDGHDTWGEDVANGVYFFRLTAAGNHVTREYTGKIAKLR